MNLSFIFIILLVFSGCNKLPISDINAYDSVKSIDEFVTQVTVRIGEEQVHTYDNGNVIDFNFGSDQGQRTLTFRSLERVCPISLNGYFIPLEKNYFPTAFAVDEIHRDFESPFTTSLANQYKPYESKNSSSIYWYNKVCVSKDNRNKIIVGARSIDKTKSVSYLVSDTGYVPSSYHIVLMKRKVFQRSESAIKAKAATQKRKEEMMSIALEKRLKQLRHIFQIKFPHKNEILKYHCMVDGKQKVSCEKLVASITSEKYKQNFENEELFLAADMAKLFNFRDAGLSRDKFKQYVKNTNALVRIEVYTGDPNLNQVAHVISVNIYLMDSNGHIPVLPIAGETNTRRVSSDIYNHEGERGHRIALEHDLISILSKIHIKVMKKIMGVSER